MLWLEETELVGGAWIMSTEPSRMALVPLPKRHKGACVPLLPQGKDTIYELEGGPLIDTEFTCALILDLVSRTVKFKFQVYGILL